MLSSLGLIGNMFDSVVDRKAKPHTHRTAHVWSLIQEREDQLEHIRRLVFLYAINRH